MANEFINAFMQGQNLQMERQAQQQAMIQQEIQNAHLYAQQQHQAEMDQFKVKSYIQDQANTDREFKQRATQYEDTNRRADQNQVRMDAKDKETERKNSLSEFGRRYDNGETVGGAAALSGMPLTPDILNSLVQSNISAGTQQPQMDPGMQKGISGGINAAMGALPGFSMGAQAASQAIPTQRTQESLQQEAMGMRSPNFERKIQEHKDLVAHQAAQEQVAEEKKNGYLSKIANDQDYQNGVLELRQKGQEYTKTYQNALVAIRKLQADTSARQADTARINAQTGQARQGTYAKNVDSLVAQRAQAVNLRKHLGPGFAAVDRLHTKLSDTERKYNEAIAEGNAIKASIPEGTTDTSTKNMYAKAVGQVEGAMRARAVLLDQPEYKQVMGYKDPETGKMVPGQWDEYKDLFNNLPDRVITTEGGKPLPPGNALGKAVNGATNAVKALDMATAKAFLNQAKGDKNKARQLAKQAGYSL